MISRSATYAVRALTFMAAREPDTWSLNREIAAELALPPQFLTKILRLLAAEGILLSQRGKSGGFRLARPASRITLLEIIDPFDRLSDRRTCLLGQAIVDENPVRPRTVSETSVRCCTRRADRAPDAPDPCRRLPAH
jgi:Rrf2 family protein